MKRNLITAAVVLLLGTVALVQHFAVRAQEVARPQVEKPRINFSAPDLTLSAIDGASYTVGGPRSKPLMINFWASWCGPCEEEAPYLKSLADKYSEQLDVYAINLTQTDKLDNARAFVERYSFDFPVLLDRSGEAAALYQIRAVPTTYIIDTNGIIIDAFYFASSEEMERRIKKAVRTDG